MSSVITMDEYKLSCELFGHSLEVRSVAAESSTAEIISGSRDKSVIVWEKKPDGIYHDKAVLCNHTNFVSCVYYLETEGWICTGSNDSTICLYRSGSVVPFQILKGHEGTVTSITKGFQAKTLFSGSWDSTGKIWNIDAIGMVTFITLKGHKATVWAVATLPNGQYVTGSADKMIYLWNSKGDSLKILKGHTDCVRGLIALADCTLLSCGNDAIIRYWNEDGECLHEYYGHTNYIYTIAMINIGKDTFITGGEDSSVRMWSLKYGVLGNPLIIPAESVWSVTCLTNGDIVTGSSDGVVRVFTKDPTRVASQPILNAYNEEVEIFKSSLKPRGEKKLELLGPESLNITGREGEKKMIRSPNGSVLCYQWKNNKWNLIDEVVGDSGTSQNQSRKKLFEGKEYDFIFTVCVANNIPRLQLPYNREENPWLAALSFIQKNELRPAYLQQVADFIVKKTTVPAAAPGGSRYAPGSGGNQNHFPIKKFVLLTTIDPMKIYMKIKEFNDKSADCSVHVSEETLQNVYELTDDNPVDIKVAVEALKRLLQWPRDIIFPILDITRLAVRFENIFILLNSSKNLLNILLPYLNESLPNQIMTIRCLSNMMCHESGREEFDKRFEEIIAAIKCIKAGNGVLQVSISILFLNATIVQIKGVANEEKCRTITEGIITFLCWSTNLEANYRSIQALGNLTSTSLGVYIRAQVVSTNVVMNKVNEWLHGTQMGSYEKLKAASKALFDLS